MGLGYAAAAGIQGGFDSLHQIIAERQKQQLLAQAEADRQQQFGLQQAEFEESKRRDLANETRLGEQTHELGLLRQGQTAAAQAGVEEKQGKAKAREDALAALEADTSLSPRDKLLAKTQIMLGGDLPGGLFQPQQTPEEKQADALERIRLTAELRPPSGSGQPSFALATIMGPDGRPQIVAVDRHDPTQKVDIGTGAPSGAQRTQQSDTEAADAGLSELDRLYKPEYVGPLAGRVNATKTKYKNTTPEMVSFFAQAAAAKNRIIKAITGAAMSAEEEKRIIEQIPEVTDPPVTFEAKLQQSRKNYQFLLDAIAKRNGGGTAPGPAPGAGGGDTDPLGILKRP